MRSEHAVLHPSVLIFGGGLGANAIGFIAGAMRCVDSRSRAQAQNVYCL